MNSTVWEDDDSNSSGTQDFMAEVVHEGITCDACGMSPLEGIRHKHGNYNLCQACHGPFHPGDHIFAKGEYDFASNILGPARGIKKLPFNKGQDPMAVAEAFIAREQIDKSDALGTAPCTRSRCMWQ